MSLVEHAKRELQIIGYNLEDPEEGPDKWMPANILELMETFAKQGHSGFSASYCINLFTKLAKFEPASPLTGEDSEWNELDGKGLFQNNRCGTVFKEADGRAYNMEGKVFRDSDGSCWVNKDSRVYIEFPYTPKTEYVDREQEE